MTTTLCAMLYLVLGMAIALFADAARPEGQKRDDITSAIIVLCWAPILLCLFVGLVLYVGKRMVGEKE